MKYHLISTKKGNTVLGCTGNGVTVVALTAGDAIDTIEDFEANPEEYGLLVRQQHTHDLTLDPKTKRVTAQPKQTKGVTSQS